MTPSTPPTVALGLRLRRLWKFMQRERLDRLLFLLLVIVLASTVSITLVEPEINLLNGLWWSVVTMTTVGYGDISPHSMGGRIIAMVVMFLGIGLLGMFSATVASVLVSHKLREDHGLTHAKYRQHIILCEWNHRTAALLRDLRADPKTAHAPIVLIADLPSKPIDDDDLHFISGQVNDETLQRANLAEAQTVVILGDDRLEPTARDAKVVLACLTVESINRNVYTIVELVSDANVRHCLRANANEIVVNSNLTSGLLARAALDHGITKVIGEWLSADHGDELYKIKPPSSLVNQPFAEILAPMKIQYSCIVIGVEQGEDGEVISNPPADYVVRPGDRLVVVAPTRPEVS
ncbi:MAG TPA: ion channel [Caldilineaceae bacterium]|nr:ion channel [Caldilineaceae bacterium]